MEPVSGLYVSWVMLQYPWRVGPSPASLQDRVLGRTVLIDRCLWGGLTAWSADLDGLAAGHRLGARLANTFFTTEGHLITNRERLPVGVGMRKRISFSCLKLLWLLLTGKACAWVFSKMCSLLSKASSRASAIQNSSLAKALRI